MKTAPAQKYRDSEKRKITKEQNRAAIQKAAWEVFCTIGMDAANIRDIVNRSGLPPGTFYNYYRKKEAIFEALSQGESLGWWARNNLRSIMRALFHAAKDWKLWDGDIPTNGVRIGKKKSAKRSCSMSISCGSCWHPCRIT